MSSPRPWHLLVWLVCAVLLAACNHAPPVWQLNEVSGHLPDLQFELTSDADKPATAADFRGKYVLLYFGYTHCPDVCPLTLVHLHLVMQKLGADADKTRILFVSVDPARDTPAVLRQYVIRVRSACHRADRHAIAARRDGEALPRGLQRGKPQPDGGYEVNHSSGIYIFDRDGRARLIGTSADSVDAIAHDLKLLMRQD